LDIVKPHNTDSFWFARVPGQELVLSRWLRDRGSLTQRIQQRCNLFEVRNVFSGSARVELNESFLLGIPSRQNAFTREVFLYADGKPVVFAHSVVAHQHLRGAWSAVDGMGNKPLGALLFAHPLVSREPLHFKSLRSNNQLYKSASMVLSDPPGRLWARRSLFHLHGAPLLVTEVFLPGIMNLSNTV